MTLRRGTDVRRIPFWGRVAVPQLGKQRLLPLRSPGLHTGTTAGRPALVSRYRYPTDPMMAVLAIAAIGWLWEQARQRLTARWSKPSPPAPLPVRGRGEPIILLPLSHGRERGLGGEGTLDYRP